MTWETLDQSRPTARINHECQLCEWTIPSGSVYIKVVGLFDGDFHTYKAHAVCDAVFAAVDFEYSGDEGTPDPHGFRQLLAHVINVEKVPYQLTPAHETGFKVNLELPSEDVGFWDYDSWHHEIPRSECVRCAS